MISITKPVGILKENESNSPADVRKIQGLLNENLHLLPGISKLVVDGKVGKNFEKSKTIAAIKEFQAKVVKMAKPDGRIDLLGNTLKKLNANARKPRPANVSQFVNKISADAKKINIKYQIPASILIAQAALESGWGGMLKIMLTLVSKHTNPSGHQQSLPPLR